MQIDNLDVSDPAVVDELWRLTKTVHEQERQGNPPPVEEAFRAGFGNEFPGHRTLRRGVWKDGRLAGCSSITLNDRENKHLATITGAVDPDRRREGVGQALLDDAVRTAGDNGRTTFMCAAREPAEGGPFRSPAASELLAKNGFKISLRELNRGADVDALGEREQGLLDESKAASPGYRTLTWMGSAPDEVVDSFCRLMGIFLSEAPTGDVDMEDFQMDAERMREAERSLAARGSFGINTVALDENDEVAALTQYTVPSKDADFAGQGMTLVDPAHRGKKLGIRVKIENLRRLREEFPGVKRLRTGNADTNTHMNRINDMMGFQTVEVYAEYVKKA
ncbi:GNAT family N-acetyltransferase [Salininema proteolyticum]|uniref:GNAT family N-acetyltransferase n=1 Tax=Salininema proteolyticum TaxID=1607685 RepID=A0ABV8U062_9ACTN